MRARVDSILKSIAEFFKKLTRGERIRLIVMAVVVIAVGVAVSVILSRTTYGILYTGLSSDEAGEILTTLQTMGEDVQIQGVGTILVPEKRVDELRATLSTQGLGTSGFNYDLLNSISGFGMTEQQIKSILQAQTGELIRTQLLAMNKISNCFVNVYIADESIFVVSQSSKVTSASVTLETVGGATLTQTEVDAVADTVINAVPGLKAENLAIVDTNMKSYKIGEAGEISGDISGQLAFKQELQALLEEQALNVTTPILGPDDIRVQANAELNFDRIVHEIIDYEPPVAGEEGGLVRSIYTLWEAQRTDGTAAGVVGTDANGMGATEYPYGTLEEGEQFEKRVNETNYELDQTITQIEEAMGKITGLSLAVTINSSNVAEDYTQQVRELVAMATGVDERYVTVVRAPFRDESASIQEALAEQQEYLKSMQLRELIITAIKWALIVLLVVLVLLFVRSIVRSASRGAQPDAAGVGGSVDYVAGDILSELQEGAQYKDIDLTAKPESVANLEKLIDRDAGAVAQLLRNWLSDD